MDTLPLELLLMICSELTDRDIAHLIRTAWRYHFNCGGTLVGHKAKYLTRLNESINFLLKEHVPGSFRVIELTSTQTKRRFYMALSHETSKVVSLLEERVKRPFLISDDSFICVMFTHVSGDLAKAIKDTFLYLITSRMIDGTICNFDVKDPSIHHQF